jgi:hypothetical protein
VSVRALIVLLLACMAVGMSLLGAPLAALVAGFAAAVLAIEFVFPTTGFLRIDAQRAFQRLAWERRREALRKWISRRHAPGQLELLPESLGRTAERRRVGTEPIALNSIVGTVEPEKAIAFDHAFRPPGWSRGRWELMWIACRRGDRVPPITVYRFCERHFVIDGHHRVSVARSLNAGSIDADVIELMPLSSGPRTGPAASAVLQPLVPPLAPMRAVGREPSRMSALAMKHKLWTSHGWRPLLLFLAVGFGLTLLSGALGPAPGYVLILTACAFVGRGLGSSAHAGLEDHRQ